MAQATNPSSLIPQQESSAVGYPHAAPRNPYGLDPTLSTMTNPMMGGNQVDLWGAVLRRKFIVILLGLIGAGLGYLHYIKTPETFRSSLRLSVTAQSPPNIINGESFMQKVPMVVHKNLLTSELVLSKAVRKGELEKTEMLLGATSPTGKIKKSLTVQAQDKSDEVLLLSLTGSSAEDLPRILSSIVDAYTEVVSEDNRAVGQESIELIEKLQKQLVEDTSRAEIRYMELIREIGAEGTNDEGKMINPYAPKVKMLMTERNDRQQELQDVLERLSMALKAMESGEETELKVVAIEAKRRLGLNYDDRRDTQESRRIESLTTDLRNIDRQSDKLREQIMELNFQKRELSETFGTGHARMRSLDERIKYFQSELETTIKQRNDLAASIESINDDSSNELVDWNALQAKTDQQWIKLYLVALERDQNRLITNLKSLTEELAQAQSDAAKISGDVAEIRLLERQIEDKRDSLRVIIERLSEINLLSQNYNNIRVRVLDPPGLGLQTDPIIFKSIGGGIFLFGLLGVGLALLIDRADLSFHNPTEIFTRVDVPVVGRIPRLQLSEGKDGKTLGSVTLVSANHPSSAGAEAFRTIRTHLFFDSATNGTKVLMITSPSPGDGKSTAACNLAVSIAQSGKRVVLLDADLRRPRIHAHFGIESKTGLMAVLKGESTLKDALHSTFLPNLFVLPCGHRPKNPGEVVTSPNFAKTIEMLRESFDFVILDTPPVLPVSDPTSIATLVDGIYLVFRIRRGVKITASRAKECLSQVNARLMGVIVNGLDENPHYNDYGGYYQHSGYGTYGKAYQDRMAKAYKEYIE